ncbi:unnamed protein product [Triticum turgidum subsp. durum]|uniref:Ribulose bisphosphate carboxylase small subunit n=1 Tax=Triticum turgidum subsp. durum TaxID=4567 RepID=A0A9R0X6I5_TRITD|nr:unnamed protein product [Triticum turgidum subsp. durum]
MAPTVMASSATSVAPFQGLKSTAGLPVSRRSNGASLGSVSNGGRIRCMQVWPIEGIKKFETLSYLPPLSTEALLKQVDYLIRSKWVPCLEFSKVGFIFREHNASPGYYDGRYWTMWKLPMFGCTDATQVINEVEEVRIRQHAPGAVRQLHRLQATGLRGVRQGLNSSLTTGHI